MVNNHFTFPSKGLCSCNLNCIQFEILWELHTWLQTPTLGSHRKILPLGGEPSRGVVMTTINRWSHRFPSWFFKARGGVYIEYGIFGKQESLHFMLWGSIPLENRDFSLDKFQAAKKWVPWRKTMHDWSYNMCFQLTRSKISFLNADPHLSHRMFLVSECLRSMCFRISVNVYP